VHVDALYHHTRPAPAAKLARTISPVGYRHVAILAAIGQRHASHSVMQPSSPNLMTHLNPRIYTFGNNSNIPSYPQPHDMPTPALPETLSLERCVNLLASPINFHLATIYILIDRHHALRHVHVRLLALLEHLEYEIATDGRVVCVTKVLVNPLLE
jgi:hypothetical protein